jgi:hypothetical protein
MPNRIRQPLPCASVSPARIVPLVHARVESAPGGHAFAASDGGGLTGVVAGSVQPAAPSRRLDALLTIAVIGSIFAAVFFLPGCAS